MSDKHSCCKRSQQKKTLRSYVAAAIAAFLACLCCSMPLIPLMLGLSAGSSLLSLSKYHALFDVLGGLVLVGSLLYIWHEHKDGERSGFRNRQFWICLVVTFAMYAGMNLLIKNYVAPRLLGGQSSVHDHGGG